MPKEAGAPHDALLTAFEKETHEKALLDIRIRVDIEPVFTFRVLTTYLHQAFCFLAIRIGVVVANAIFPDASASFGAASRDAHQYNIAARSCDDISLKDMPARITPANVILLPLYSSCR
jgi:hypothetical protein